MQGLNHHNSNELNDVFKNHMPPTWQLLLLSLPSVFYPPSTDSYMKSYVLMLQYWSINQHQEGLFFGDISISWREKNKEQIKDLTCVLGKIYGIPLLARVYKVYNIQGIPPYIGWMGRPVLARWWGTATSKSKKTSFNYPSILPGLDWFMYYQANRQCLCYKIL
jgi:hypothetical protein